MNETANKKLTQNSRTLRKNMTKEERHLWYDFLKSLPETVQRQKVIGNYIVDFYFAEGKLAIELDGSQHYENPEADRVRDQWLAERGILVLRYANSDIHGNFQGVCEDILHHMAARGRKPSP